MYVLQLALLKHQIISKLKVHIFNYLKDIFVWVYTYKCLKKIYRAQISFHMQLSFTHSKYRNLEKNKIMYNFVYSFANDLGLTNWLLFKNNFEGKHENKVEFILQKIHSWIYITIASSLCISVPATAYQTAGASGYVKW